MASLAHIFRILFHQFALCTRVSENSKLNSIFGTNRFMISTIIFYSRGHSYIKTPHKTAPLSPFGWKQNRYFLT